MKLQTHKHISRWNEVAHVWGTSRSRYSMYIRERNLAQTSLCHLDSSITMTLLFQCIPNVERVADHFDKVADRPPQCHDLVIPEIIDGRGNGVPEGVFHILLKIKGATQNGDQIGGGLGDLPQKFLKNQPLKGAILRFLTRFWPYLPQLWSDFNILKFVVLSRLPSTRVADQQRSSSRPFWPAVGTLGKHCCSVLVTLGHLGDSRLIP